MDDTSLDPAERDEFLGDGGTGVLAFASPAPEPPHAIPVSYGYDAAREEFYLRLAVGADREKGDPTGRPVTLVVYGETDGWTSVVAEGELTPTDGEDAAADTLAGLERTQIPFVEIFGEPPAETTFEFFRLTPASLTARREAPSGL